MYKTLINRRKNIFTIIISMILVSILLISGCGRKKDQDINISYNIPLTGQFSLWGSRIQNGVILAKEEIQDKNNGLINRINFNFGDNESKANKAVSLMKKQFMKPVDIYVSGIKPQTMAIFDFVNKKNVPYFVWVYDAFICKENNNVFRTLISYKYEPRLYLKYIKEVNPTKIAIAYVNLPHAKEEFEDILIPKLYDMGYSEKDILVEVYDFNVKDFKNIAAKFTKFAPELIILNGFQNTVAGLVRSLRSYNLIEEGNVIGTYDMVDAANLLSNEEVEGIRAITPMITLNWNSKKVSDWRKKYKKKFGKEPMYIDAFAYDMTLVMYEAIKKSNGNLTKEEIIRNISNISTDGITGKLEFDDEGDLITPLAIGVYRNGEFKSEYNVYKP